MSSNVVSLKSQELSQLENWLGIMEPGDANMHFLPIYKGHISKLSFHELKRFLELCRKALDKQKNKEVQTLITEIQNYAYTLINHNA